MELTPEQWQTLQESTKGEEALRKVLDIFGVPYPEKPAERKRQILIVDDDAAIVNFVKAVLERKGFETLVTSNARAALSMLLFQNPDLVLLDINMPEVDGGEVFSKIREMPHTCRTPVIFMTGLIDPTEESHLNETPEKQMHYLGKPFTAEKLITSISRMLHA